MMTLLSRWLSAKSGRRTDAADEKHARRAGHGRRLSFEQCESRAMLSATSAVDEATPVVLTPDVSEWKLVSHSDLRARISSQQFNLHWQRPSFLDFAVHEGGIVLVDRLNDVSVASGRGWGKQTQLDFDSLPTFGSVLQNAFYSYDATIAGHGDLGGFADRTSAPPLSNIDLGSLQADPLADAVAPTTSDATASPSSNSIAIYLAMRPSMQPIEFSQISASSGEGGSIDLTSRAMGTGSLARKTAIATGSLQLAVAEGRRRTVAGVDDDPGGEKLRARAVALEVGGENVAHAEAWRAGARDEAFGDYDQERSSHETKNNAPRSGNDSADARPTRREREARAEKAATNNADDAETQAHNVVGRATAELLKQHAATSRLISDDHEPAALAPRGDDGKSDRLDADADDARSRTAAGMAALLIGGGVWSRRRNRAEGEQAAQLPPRRRTRWF